MTQELSIFNTDMMALEEELNNTGKELYTRNSVYRDLANVLEHPMMRDFIDRFIGDYEETISILMFIKIYKEIERKSSIELSPYQKLAILDKIINTTHIRRRLCESVIHTRNIHKSLTLC